MIMAAVQGITMSGCSDDYNIIIPVGRTQSDGESEVPDSASMLACKDDVTNHVDTDGLSRERLVEIITSQSREMKLIRATLEKVQFHYTELLQEHSNLMDYIQSCGGPHGDVRPGGDVSNDDVRYKGDVTDDVMVTEVLQSLESELHVLKTHLDGARRREARVREELQLRPDAPERQVLERIHELRHSNALSRERLAMLERQFRALEEEKVMLKRRQVELQTTLRLKLVEMKQIKEREKQRQRREQLKLKTTPIGVQVTPPPTYDLPRKEVTTLSVLYRPPPIGAPAKQRERHQELKPLLKPPTSRDRCVLCGQQYDLAGTWCSVHSKTFKDGRWGCCEGDSGSRGCLHVPHLRLELVPINRIYITDDGLKTLRIK